MAKTAYDIIRKPIITEKSMNATAEKKYTFKVDVNANKVEIKQAIEEIFGVTVIKVTTTNGPGKMKRQGALPAGYQKNWKKAVVKLSADSKDIELFQDMV